MWVNCLLAMWSQASHLHNDGLSFLCAKNSALGYTEEKAATTLGRSRDKVGDHLRASEPSFVKCRQFYLPKLYSRFLSAINN